MSAPLSVAVVVGSTTPDTFGRTIARWFVEEARRRDDLALELVDLGMLWDDRERFAKHIDSADAVVVVVPEYNHSFPGPLKTAIDELGHEWFAKPVGVVSYGGISGGLRATEQLRLVLAELHAVTIRETISFHGGRATFGEDDTPLDASGADAAATRFLGNLTWWANALREAKARVAYPA